MYIGGCGGESNREIVWFVRRAVRSEFQSLVCSRGRGSPVCLALRRFALPASRSKYGTASKFKWVLFAGGCWGFKTYR